VAVCAGKGEMAQRSASVQKASAFHFGMESVNLSHAMNTSDFYTGLADTCRPSSLVNSEPE
jgi:hypothetical protein